MEVKSCSIGRCYLPNVNERLSCVRRKRKKHRRSQISCQMIVFKMNFIKCLFCFTVTKISLTTIAQQIPIYSSRTADFSDFALETLHLKGLSLSGALLPRFPHLWGLLLYFLVKKKKPLLNLAEQWPHLINPFKRSEIILSSDQRFDCK